MRAPLPLVATRKPGGFPKQHRQCLDHTDSLAAKRSRSQPLESLLSLDDRFQRLQPRITHRLTDLAHVLVAFPNDHVFGWFPEERSSSALAPARSFQPSVLPPHPPPQPRRLDVIVPPAAVGAHMNEWKQE